jgi:DNA/RNA endonuclease YhcR with UshA esterase domain
LDLEVKPGRLAQVTGILKDSFGLLVLVPAAGTDVTLGHAGFQPVPRLVATSAVGEPTEGKLVRVLGRITQAPTSDLPYGYKFWIDDGSGEVQIFVNVETGIDLAGLRLGQVVLVTGFSGQFDADYEVLPRSPHDIRVIH